MDAVIIDFETFSPHKDRGLDVYMQDIQPLIMGWRTLKESPVFTTDVLSLGPLRFWGDMKNILTRYLDWGFKFIAHNYNFEKKIIELIIQQEIPIDQFVCTMALCATNGLPLGLGNACEFLGIPGKHKEGQRLINKFCQPRKPTKNNPSTRVMPQDDPKDFKLFIDYCKQDIKAEYELFKRLY